MALEQGFVVGSVTTDGTNATNISLGFEPRFVIISNETAAAVGFTFIEGAAAGTMLLDAAPNLDTTNEVVIYAGGDKLVYDETNSWWELDGGTTSVANEYVDETGQVFAERVIHKDPVDGAFVYTTPGITVPAASTLNDGTEVQFIAFR